MSAQKTVTIKEENKIEDFKPKYQDHRRDTVMSQVPNDNMNTESMPSVNKTLQKKILVEKRSESPGFNE